MKVSLNVGGADRMIRLFVGGALIWMAFSSLLTGNMAMVAYVVGAVALFAGIVRFCPAYVLFGVKTYSDKLE